MVEKQIGGNHRELGSDNACLLFIYLGLQPTTVYALTHFERDLRRLSWRLRPGLGVPVEEEEEEEEPERLDPERLEPDEELDPLEEPELEPELLLEDELERDLRGRECKRFLSVNSVSVNNNKN